MFCLYVFAASCQYWDVFVYRTFSHIVNTNILLDLLNIQCTKANIALHDVGLMPTQDNNLGPPQMIIFILNFLHVC